jgi:hypothetical protein
LIKHFCNLPSECVDTEVFSLRNLVVSIALQELDTSIIVIILVTKHIVTILFGIPDTVFLEAVVELNFAPRALVVFVVIAVVSPKGQPCLLKAVILTQIKGEENVAQLACPKRVVAIVV